MQPLTLLIDYATENDFPYKRETQHTRSQNQDFLLPSLTILLPTQHTQHTQHAPHTPTNTHPSHESPLEALYALFIQHSDKEGLLTLQATTEQNRVVRRQISKDLRYSRKLNTTTIHTLITELTQQITQAA